jgi:hypothetical protein
MKAEACRGLERSLIEGDAGASVCRLKRQGDQRLLVVGVGLFIVERVDETVWWLDGTEGPADVEDIPIWRLHGDPVVGPLHRVELQALNGESGGAPPAPELLCIDERGEDPLLGTTRIFSRWSCDPVGCSALAMSSIMAGAPLRQGSFRNTGPGDGPYV